MGCIVSKLFLDFYIFFIFTRPLSLTDSVREFFYLQLVPTRPLSIVWWVWTVVVVLWLGLGLWSVSC